jgi:putative hydrolases of HD superfamily
MKDVVKLYSEINKLKELTRAGWLKHLPKEKCEHVADHCFNMALLALFTAERYYPELDVLKVVKMALIHELGEIYAGDITPYDTISAEEKFKKEKESFEKVFESFTNKDEYIALWQEFEAGNTPEARFVRNIDIIEMALQAKTYENKYELDLHEAFVEWTKKRITDPKLESFLE